VLDEKVKENMRLLTQQQDAIIDEAQSVEEGEEESADNAEIREKVAVEEEEGEDYRIVGEVSN
jgi:hypothetical protein